MSLITLTFGDRGNCYSETPHTLISTPETAMANKAKSIGARAQAIIRKTCNFYSQNDIYVIAEVINGFIGQDMQATLNGKTMELLEIESKFGHSAKKGMTVGLTLKGISKEELKTGETIFFEKN